VTAGIVAGGLVVMFLSAVIHRIESPSRKVFTNATQETEHGGVADAQRQAAMGQLTELMAQLRENPDDPAVLVEIGRSFLAMQDFSRADLFASRALDADPDNIPALKLYGLSASGQKRNEMAAQSFAKIVELDPTDGGARYNLGLLYRYHLNREAEAKEQFELAAEHTAGDPRLEGLVREELDKAP
jgi:tetratricopeptide (TPR) repeat protein